MHPVILICNSPFSESGPLVEALQRLGVEVRATTLEEIQHQGLVVRETTLVVDRRPESFSISFGVRHRREEGLSRLLAHVLIAAPLANLHPRDAELLKIPEPPPEFKVEEAVKVLAFLDDKLVFEKPKPDWPKPQHVKPVGQWKHRPAASHPACSRDKRFMR